jgi:hypothetical protein
LRENADQQSPLAYLHVTSVELIGAAVAQYLQSKRKAAAQAK